MKQEKAADKNDSSIAHDLSVYKKAAKLAYDYQKKRAEEELQSKQKSSDDTEKIKQEQ